MYLWKCLPDLKYFYVKSRLSYTGCLRNRTKLKFVQSTLSHLQSPPEQMQSQRNYGSFLSKSHLHGIILLTMLAQKLKDSALIEQFAISRLKDNALVEQFAISRLSVSNREKQLRYV